MPSGDDYWRNDERAVRSRDDLDGWDRLLTDLVYYGLGQLLLLGAPAFWILYRTPATLALDAAIVGAVVALPLTVGLGRNGRLPIGRAWPALSNRKLGTGEGYAAYLTRAVHLGVTLLAASFAGAAVGVVSGVSFAGAVVAAGLAAVGGGLIPFLAPPGAVRIRAGYYVAALAVAVAGVLVAGVLDPAVVPLVALYVLGAGYDLRAAARRGGS